MFTFSKPRWWWVMLTVGALTWILCIIFDILQRIDTRDGNFPFFAHWMFDADADRGLAESAGYLFMLVAAGALIFTWLQSHRGGVYVVLAAIFIVIVAVDSMRIHERAGGVLSRSAGSGPALGLRAQDLGELAVWGLIAAPLGLLFCITWCRSYRQARRSALKVVACLVVMFVFATVIDTAGPATSPDGLDWHYHFRYGLKLFEYSGEYLSMIAACLVSLRLATTIGQPDNIEETHTPEAAPVEEVPVEAVPVEEVPVEAVPVEAVQTSQPALGALQH